MGRSEEVESMRQKERNLGKDGLSSWLLVWAARAQSHPDTLRNWVAPGFSALMQHLAVPVDSTVSRPSLGVLIPQLWSGPREPHGKQISQGFLRRGALGRAAGAPPEGSPAPSTTRTTSAVPELERDLRFPGDGGGRSGAMTSKPDGGGEAARLGPRGSKRIRALRPPSDVCSAPKTFTDRLRCALTRGEDPANPSDRRDPKVKPSSAGG